MLHAIDFKGWDSIAWCVPTAISFLTGTPLFHAHSRAAFLQDKKLKEVKGVYCEEAVLLLREQGYKAIPIDLPSRYSECPTINRFLKERTPYEYCMPIMFATVDHMMTCHMGFVADNWTKRPVPIAECPKPNRKVEAAWVVFEDKHR